MVIFVAIIDLIRVEVATKGNKVGEWRILLTSSCLSLPVIVGMVFFLRLQTYVYVHHTLHSGIFVLISFETNKKND